MKILHILNYVGRGGSESYIKNLLNTTNSDITHELLYNIDGGGLESFRTIGIKATQVNMVSSLDLKAAFQLKKYVEARGIDLVHTHFMRENGIAFLASVIGMKVPIVNTRHMVTIINKRAALLNRLFFTRNQVIFAVSSIVREQLVREGVDPKRIVTLPPPFPVVDCIDSVEKPKGEKWILSVGRLSEEKGPLFFIDALNALFKEVSGVKALIIGSGDLEEATFEKIRAYGLDDKVQMLGYNDNPYPYLKAADIYVNHSKEEAFGLSIVEAAYCRAPLLITNNCGASDYFNEENGAALTYSFGNVDEFVHKASKLLHDATLRKVSVERASTVVFDEISQDKIITTIEKTYKGAIHAYEKA